MKTRNMLLFSFAMILIGMIVGTVLYPQFPEIMASHWDVQGNPNGYMSRFWGVFLMPLVMIGMTLLMWGLPEIDPLKSNIDKFRGDYYNFIVVLNIYFLYIHVLTMLINLGIDLDLSRFVIPGMGVFIFFLGGLISKAKRNWFVGIRTPWTLSSDRVWEKTHQYGGLFFRVAGIITLAGFIFPGASMWILLISIFVPMIFLYVYSYFLYRDEQSGSSN